MGMDLLTDMDPLMDTDPRMHMEPHMDPHTDMVRLMDMEPHTDRLMEDTPMDTEMTILMIVALQSNVKKHEKQSERPKKARRRVKRHIKNIIKQKVAQNGPLKKLNGSQTTHNLTINSPLTIFHISYLNKCQINILIKGVFLDQIIIIIHNVSHVLQRPLMKLTSIQTGMSNIKS